MRKYNPYRNIFYFYRGPSSDKDAIADEQVEDNTTKALINTLEYGGSGLLPSFLNNANVQIKEKGEPVYDLQTPRDLSRVDAEIRIGLSHILIESKVDLQLDKEQIEKHLSSLSKGYLICITPREEDNEIVVNMRRKNLRFIAWKDVYCCFKTYKGEGANFVVEQFLQYLEARGLAPFDGWKRKDFETFLYRDDDPTGEDRKRVMEKLKQYLAEVEGELKRERLFEETEHGFGKIQKAEDHIWGFLRRPSKKEKVHEPHFNFVINSDTFSIGVQIEAKDAALKMRDKVTLRKDGFLEILRKLDEFDLVINERILNRLVGIRQYDEKVRAVIRIGEKTEMADVEFVIHKMKQYSSGRKLFSINCGKSFKRDEDKKILDNQSSLSKKSVEVVRQLWDYYTFSIG